MDTFAFFAKLLVELILEGIFFLFGKVLFFNIGNFSPYVRHYEEVFIFSLRHFIDTLIGKFYLVIFFIDNKKEILIYLVHLAVVILHIVVFSLLKELLHTLFAEELNQCFVLRKSAVYTQKEYASLFGVAFRDEFFGLSQDIGQMLALFLHEGFYRRLEHIELVELPARHRAGDDQRCTCIVNEYRVDLIHNRIIMRTLYKFVRGMCHIVTKIVETKFVIGTIGNIGSIGHATTRRVRLVVINTFYLKSMELKKRRHPSTVSACQVVIDSNQVYPITSEGVEVKWQSSH